MTRANANNDHCIAQVLSEFFYTVLMMEPLCEGTRVKYHKGKCATVEYRIPCITAEATFKNQVHPHYPKMTTQIITSQLQ